MSRSGYSDDYDDENGALAMYRGMVASATRGKRGQALFKGGLGAIWDTTDYAAMGEELARTIG